MADRAKCCMHCGDGFRPESHLQKYCNDECAWGAQLRKMRNRSAEEQAKNLAALKHVTEAKPVRVIKRASSLASTPDTPAHGIDRGEQLTGACAARCQADSPCR